MLNRLKLAMSNLRNKARLLQGIVEGETAYAAPIYVDIDLTRRCNLRCAACPYHSLYRENDQHAEKECDISYSTVERLCRELKDFGTASIIVIGDGEPLLHPNAAALLELIKRSGFHVTLQTNGTLLTRELIESLISVQHDVIKVSLWATSAEQYALNYPATRKDYFDRVLQGLRLVTELKKQKHSALPSLMIHHPINAHNYQTLDRMVDLAVESGCNGITFAPVYQPHHVGAVGLLSPDQEAVALAALGQVRKRLDRLGVTHNVDDALLRFRLGRSFWESLPCYIGWYHAKVRSDGTVEPCCRCQIPLGNVNKASFREIWNGAAYREFRRRTTDLQRLGELARDCPCTTCTHLPLNFRVHRLMRWLPGRRGTW